MAIPYWFRWPYPATSAWVALSFNQWQLIQLSYIPPPATNIREDTHDSSSVKPPTVEEYIFDCLSLQMVVPIGRHEYKFLVVNNGRKKWVYDIMKPSCDDGFGGRNNYLINEGKDVYLWASVSTGLESITSKEISQKLRIEPPPFTIGHLCFVVPEGLLFVDPEDSDRRGSNSPGLSGVRSLRTFEHLFLIIDDRPLNPSEGEAEDRRWIGGIIHEDTFKHSVQLLNRFNKIGSQQGPTSPLFRVTAKKKNRNLQAPSSSGESNAFFEYPSTTISYWLGSCLVSRLNWHTVSLKEFTTEFVVRFTPQRITTLLRLTHSLKKKSNAIHTTQLCPRPWLTALGPTTLPPTLAAAMVCLANIQAGSIVLDPTGGTGVIPIEAALMHKDCFFLSVDIMAGATEKALSNATNAGIYGRMDIMRADALKLPFISNSIDTIICDLPFGIREKLISNKTSTTPTATEAATSAAASAVAQAKGRGKENPQVLYPLLLKEMNNVLKPLGIAVLLTKHHAILIRAVKESKSSWWLRSYKLVKRWSIRVAIVIIEKRNVNAEE